MLKSDLGVESDAISKLNQGIDLARSAGDNGSRELLERMLLSEEKHANWLEEQLTLLEQIGEQNYLAQQIKKEE